jgi:hypothetical protein
LLLTPPAPPVQIIGSAFSWNASAVVPVDFTSFDSSQPGTVYTFDDYARSTLDINEFDIEILVGADFLTVWVTLDGYCTRTGSTDLGDSSNGYCHFTYTAYDPVSSSLLGSFAAEGSVAASADFSELIIKGGSDIFLGVSGRVQFVPSVLDNTIDPPLIDSATDDVFDSVDGYLHVFTLQTEPSENFLMV